MSTFPVAALGEFLASAEVKALASAAPCAQAEAAARFLGGHGHRYAAQEWSDNHRLRCAHPERHCHYDGVHDERPELVLIDVDTPAKDAYRYEKAVRRGGRTVRARVRRHASANQSWAISEVLAADFSWRPVAATDPMCWYVKTPPPQPYVPIRAMLAPIADELLNRSFATLP